jgi:hypothetical protein
MVSTTMKTFSSTFKIEHMPASLDKMRRAAAPDANGQAWHGDHFDVRKPT